MFIELTNTADGHLGDKIYINGSQITSVYDFASVEGGSRMTCLYIAQGDVTYNVEESISEVLKKIKNASV